MFEQSFLSNGKTRRSWTVLVAFGGQLIAIGILLASPLLFIDAPPVTQFTAMLLAPPPPPPPHLLWRPCKPRPGRRARPRASSTLASSQHQEQSRSKWRQSRISK